MKKNYFNDFEKPTYSIFDTRENVENAPKEFLFFNNRIAIQYTNRNAIYSLRDSEFMLDYFILDTKDGFYNLINFLGVYDGFYEVFNKILQNHEVYHIGDRKLFKLFDKKTNKMILEVVNGQITYFDAMDTKIIYDNFLYMDKGMKFFIGTDVERVGNNFMPYSSNLKQVILNSTKQIGEYTNKNEVFIAKKGNIYAPRIETYPTNLEKRIKKELPHGRDLDFVKIVKSEFQK